MKSKYKYCITCEASNLKLIPHPKKELQVQASEISDKYAALFPKEMKPDITYFSAVSFTMGTINKNNCLVLPDEGMKMYKTSVGTPLDIEHEKDQIVGFCINSFLTNLKNNKILTDDEAQEILDADGKVNVGVILGIWPLNNPEIDSLIQENFDKNSDNYNKVKLSFECYFNDFSYFVSDGKADYPNGTIYPADNENADEMWAALRTNGGNGLYKGNKISICPLESFIGGNGLVMNPANVYSDLTSKKDGDSMTMQNVSADVPPASNPSVPIIAEETDNKNEVKSVILTKEDNMSKENTITTEVKAAVQPEVKAETAAMAPLKVDDTLANALQSELEKKVAELGAKDKQISEVDAKVTELLAKLEAQDKAAKAELDAAKAETAKATEMATKIQAQLDAAIEKLNNLETQEKERKHKELVASRLATLREFMTITEANLAVLEKECSELSDDEFNKKVELYKTLSPKVVTASEAPKAEDVKDTVKTAVADTAKEAKSVNIITPTPSVSLMEKFATAFSPESLGFKL
jgi:ribosome-associated translation inhibitor RaiA